MPNRESPEERLFLGRLADRLTELRLTIDLGEITTPAAFRAALERGGMFKVDDPRVRQACAAAGLESWLP